MNAPTPDKPLDLCDRCGKILSALDGHRASKKGRTDLLLCSVHLRDHGPALEKQGWTIELLVTPEPVGGPTKRVECGVCGGGAAARRVTVHASTPVQIVQCIACDTRTCNHVVGKDRHDEPIKCDKRVADGKDPICAGGHVLMVEAP